LFYFILLVFSFYKNERNKSTYFHCHSIITSCYAVTSRHFFHGPIGMFPLPLMQEDGIKL
jgi:hypothetical protein